MYLALQACVGGDASARGTGQYGQFERGSSIRRTASPFYPSLACCEVRFHGTVSRTDHLRPSPITKVQACKTTKAPSSGNPVKRLFARSNSGYLLARVFFIKSERRESRRRMAITENPVQIPFRSRIPQARKHLRQPNGIGDREPRHYEERACLLFVFGLASLEPYVRRNRRMRPRPQDGRSPF